MLPLCYAAPYCDQISLGGGIDIVVTYQEATLLWVDLLDLPQELSELGPDQMSFETLLIQVNSVEQSHLGPSSVDISRRHSDIWLTRLVSILHVFEHLFKFICVHCKKAMSNLRMIYG